MSMFLKFTHSKFAVWIFFFSGHLRVSEQHPKFKLTTSLTLSCHKDKGLIRRTIFKHQLSISI